MSSTPKVMLCGGTYHVFFVFVFAASCIRMNGSLLETEAMVSAHLNLDRGTSGSSHPMPCAEHTAPSCVTSPPPADPVFLYLGAECLLNTATSRKQNKKKNNTAHSISPPTTAQLQKQHPVQARREPSSASHTVSKRSLLSKHPWWSQRGLLTLLY